MNQHTKGPWNTRHGQSYTAICSGEKVVGYIDHFNEHDKRLVTSAPDLLKQRDELLKALTDLLGEAEAIASVIPAYAESKCIKQAKAAIAKICGKEINTTRREP